VPIDATLLALLGAVAAIAACLDAIAGGGGLITVPALLLTGLDPLMALGTNKASGTVGSLSSTIAYAKKGYVDWREALPTGFASGAGAFAGAACARLAPKSVLEAAIPLVLIAVAMFFAFYRIAPEQRDPRIGKALFATTAGAGIGFYDGLFGPGTGSFFLLAFLTLRGLTILPATGCAKVGNAASNLSSLAYFIYAGAIVWPIALSMAVGSYIGAQAGARLAIRFGAKAIRPLIVAVCLAMATKLLLNPANPVTSWARAAAGL
jgi:hypothetical protein